MFKNKFPFSENFMQKPLDKRPRMVYNGANMKPAVIGHRR